MTNPILEEIGLTKKEAEVYQTLLHLGESPIADLIDETDTHPQIIYRVLDNLTEKDLVIVTYRRHRKYVRAEDPRRLEQMELKKLKELRKTLPELLALQKISKDAIIRVAKGKEAIRSLRYNAFKQMKPKTTYLILGASGDRFYEVIGPYYNESERIRVRKQISKKFISFESQRKHLEKDPYRKLTDWRYLPGRYPIPASTNIFAETVAFLIWSKEPIVITITSPEVAEIYKHYFEALWKIAKR